MRCKDEFSKGQNACSLSLASLKSWVLLEGSKGDHRVVATKAEGVGDCHVHVVLLLLLGDGVKLAHLVNDVVLKSENQH